ncbi:O-antigen ligase family protein [Polynucleobacter necessarius]|uniref:O-antigen ligase family protein n=1 Tax=Polynucleobacter necessarius TaxID=576610 RepID=UPI0013B058EE|nr:O-antigen ligase family protein [Polynucleobacter necessarius]
MINLKSIHKMVFFVALFTLIPLWNIPHTIAGRYLCEGALLICVLFYKPDWSSFFQKNKLLVVFFVYLGIQLIFFSENYQAAFSNFRAEWMHFILFSIIGAGTGLILGRKNSHQFLLYLGIAFSVPLYIHLILFLFKSISIGAIPWGYSGINLIHGDFAYPALEAIILLCTFCILQTNGKIYRYIAIALMTICVVSPLLAASRGGVGFSFIGAFFVMITYFLFDRDNRISNKKKIFLLLSIPILIAGIYKIGVVSNPNRWSGILSRVAIGLEGNPSKVYCEGIEVLENALKDKGIEMTPSIQKGLDSVVDGDGARMMAARAGLMLIYENPMGINQSKEAYQQAITQYCNHTPKIFISHTHNAWIDTSLAIGILGAILLLMVLINYAQIGLISFRAHLSSSPFGLALFASAVMWALRGLLDSTMRDQMLEMQAFIIALFAGIVLAQNKLNSMVD